MSRYIDADKVIQILNDSMCTFPDCYVAENIEQLPTIDIVRCGECKYRDKCSTTIVFGDPMDITDAFPISYCSFGERKESE